MVENKYLKTNPLKSRYSIAVLPFANISPDLENEYFSDGITEEILNALSRIEGLHVTARTSSFAFKNQKLDVREIAEKLNVSLLLEGSIRKSGQMVRITAQLIKAEDGFHLWTETWDRQLKDIFILQDEIAGMIAERVNKDIVPRRTVLKNPVEDLDALDYYLRGNYLLNTWDFTQADNMVSAFEKAIEMNPGFIQAYIGLSGTLTWLGSTGVISPAEAQPRIEHCIEKMLELDSELPEVYTIISGKHFWMEWDIATALKKINRALELKPSYPDALMYRGLLLAAAGQMDHALNSLFRAKRLNPLSNQINFTIGLVYNYTNENEKALEYVERNIEIFPGWYAQYLVQVEALCKTCRYKEAMEVIEMLEKDPSNPLSISELKAYYYASQGETIKSLQLVNEMEKVIGKDPMEEPAIFFFLGSIYSMLQKNKEALDYLELGIQRGATPLLFVKLDSTWDQLRQEPRFLKAVSRIKYPPENQEFSLSVAKYRKATLSKERAAKLDKDLDRIMHEKRPWLNQGLTLSDLSELLDVSPHTSSQLLNEYLGLNFYDYVNMFRLKEFLNQAAKSESKQFTLLSIAYECGFNSKSTFNAFFKRTLGKTPSEYFRQAD